MNEEETRAEYIEEGIEELDEEKLPQLLNLKYQAIIDQIRLMFFNFQEDLYSNSLLQ